MPYLKSDLSECHAIRVCVCGMALMHERPCDECRSIRERKQRREEMAVEYQEISKMSPQERGNHFNAMTVDQLFDMAFRVEHDWDFHVIHCLLLALAARAKFPWQEPANPCLGPLNAACDCVHCEAVSDVEMKQAAHCE